MIRLVWVGRTKDPAAAGWIQEYRRRITHFCRVEIDEVRDAAGKGQGRAAREAQALLGKLAARAGLIVLLDEEGTEMTSREFARFLDTSIAARSEVTFVLGGPEGLGPELRAATGPRLSLSRMTLPHEVARVVLMEQIFRAFSILKGTPYHR